MTVSEDEVRFRSHIDGSAHVFTPEKSIAVQRALGADIILAFDECTSPLHDEALYRQERRPNPPLGRALAALFSRARPATRVRAGALRHRAGRRVRGSPQGERPPLSLRWTSGGWLSVATWARPKTRCGTFWRGRTPLLPPHKPRHLLGIGEVADIFDGVERGWRHLRTVWLQPATPVTAACWWRFDEGKPASKFRLNIRNARFARDPRPARGRLRLLHLSALFKSLSAPSLQG